jgi:hypothetical protein
MTKKEDQTLNPECLGTAGKASQETGPSTQSSRSSQTGVKKTGSAEEMRRYEDVYLLKLRTRNPLYRSKKRKSVGGGVEERDEEEEEEEGDSEEEEEEEK